MKILIAEDNPVPRRVLEASLQKWGYRVVVTCDGTEAWEEFQKQKEEVRLAILDWMMPGMDGVELCRRIRAADAGGYVYIILLTAKGQKGDVVTGLEAGADDYVVKPFSPEELRSRIASGVRVLKYEEALAKRNVALSRLLADAERGRIEAEELVQRLRQIIALGEGAKRALQETIDEVYTQCGILGEKARIDTITVSPADRARWDRHGNDEG